MTERDVIQRWEETPETLAPDETAVLQSHPILGQELIRFVHHLEEVGGVVRAHHERFDGQGFPDALHGEEIPWLARLLARYPRYNAQVAAFIAADPLAGRRAQVSRRYLELCSAEAAA